MPDDSPAPGRGRANGPPSMPATCSTNGRTDLDVGLGDAEGHLQGGGEVPAVQEDLVERDDAQRGPRHRRTAGLVGTHQADSERQATARSKSSWASSSRQPSGRSDAGGGAVGGSARATPAKCHARPAMCSTTSRTGQAEQGVGRSRSSSVMRATTRAAAAVAFPKSCTRPPVSGVTHLTITVATVTTRNELQRLHQRLGRWGTLGSGRAGRGRTTRGADVALHRPRARADVPPSPRSTPQGTVVLGGPAGVGKSRLAREIARRAGPDVGIVRATASAQEVPLGAFADVVPGAGPNGVPPDLADLREAVHALAHGLLVVDDAHLLDEVSATVVHQVVSSGRARVVLTVRTGEAAPDAVTALWKDELAVEGLEIEARRELVLPQRGDRVRRRPPVRTVRTTRARPEDTTWCTTVADLVEQVRVVDHQQAGARACTASRRSARSGGTPFGAAPGTTSANAPSGPPAPTPWPGRCDVGPDRRAISRASQLPPRPAPRAPPCPGASGAARAALGSLLAGR